MIGRVLTESTVQEGEGDFMLAFSSSVDAAIFCIKVSGST